MNLFWQDSQAILFRITAQSARAANMRMRVCVFGSLARCQFGEQAEE